MKIKQLLPEDWGFSQNKILRGLKGQDGRSAGWGSQGGPIQQCVEYFGYKHKHDAVDVSPLKYL